MSPNDIDIICTRKNLNAFERLMLVYIINRGWISSTEYKPLPRNRIIAEGLSADSSAVSRALKKYRELGIILNNKLEESILDISALVCRE